MTTALPFYVEPTDPPSKQELLKAALKLFARDGVRESSIRAVAAEAGFTNPVLFKYFDGKEALALHLFERCYLRLVREAMARPPQRRQLSRAAGAARRAPARAARRVARGGAVRERGAAALLAAGLGRDAQAFADRDDAQRSSTRAR